MRVGIGTVARTGGQAISQGQVNTVTDRIGLPITAIGTVHPERQRALPDALSGERLDRRLTGLDFGWHNWFGILKVCRADGGDDRRLRPWSGPAGNGLVRQPYAVPR
jgi:hypothetical protein